MFLRSNYVFLVEPLPKQQYCMVVRAPLARRAQQPCVSRTVSAAYTLHCWAIQGGDHSLGPLFSLTNRDPHSSLSSSVICALLSMVFTMFHFLQLLYILTAQRAFNFMEKVKDDPAMQASTSTRGTVYVQRFSQERAHQWGMLAALTILESLGSSIFRMSQSFIVWSFPLEMKWCPSPLAVMHVTPAWCPQRPPTYTREYNQGAANLQHAFVSENVGCCAIAISM